MTPSTEVAKTEPAGLPALAYDKASEITAQDIALPRLYVGQFTSGAVKAQAAAAGDVYVAQDGDDEDPEILNKVDDDTGVVIHVLDLRKGISRKRQGEPFEYWRYDDESAPAPGQATGAWVTYQYTVAIPSHDSDIAYRWLVSRSGQPAARKINGVIGRAAGQRPFYEPAFRLTTAYRENRKDGEKLSWYVPIIHLAEPTEKDIAVAANLYGLVLKGRQSAQVREDGPAI